MTAYAAKRVAALDRRGSLRLRAEEGLAELRHDARQGVRRQGAGRRAPASASSRRRCSRASRTCRSRRKDGSRPAAARELHRARVRVSAPARSVRRRAGPSAISSDSTRRTSWCCWRTRRRPTRGSDGWSPARSPRTAPALRERYTAGFMEALSAIATPEAPHQRAAAHGGLLQEDAGRRRRRPSCRTRSRTTASGLVPLVVPITLLRHYVRLHDVAYLAGQVYLAPHPKELMLRNHV